jgi:hypothetical protein
VPRTTSFAAAPMSASEVKISVQREVIPRAVDFIHEIEIVLSKMRASGLCAPRNGLAAAERTQATPGSRATNQKCIAAEHSPIANTIRKQWTAARMPPEPCGTRGPGTAHRLNLDRSQMPTKRGAVIQPQAGFARLFAQYRNEIRRP